MKKYQADSLDVAKYEIALLGEQFDVNAPVLFHYTRKDTLESIFIDEHMDFRFTRATDFLDKNEGINVFEPFYHGCGKLYDTGKIDRDFFLICRSISPEMIDHRKESWVLCFSENGCSPFMKERYSAKDGVIIGILRDPFNDIRFPDGIGFRIVKICYTFSKIRKDFERTILHLYSCFKKDLRKGKPESIAIDETKAILIDRLADYALCCKGNSYRREEEIRIICSVPSGFESWKSASGKEQIAFGDDKKLHLILSLEKCKYGQFDNLEITNDSSLNKSKITPEDIKKARQKM